MAEINEERRITIREDKAHQRKGLGKALLTQALLTAQGQEVKLIKLGVTKENIPAVNLYRKLGFKPEQRVTAHIWEAY